jgi:hypothetical protein
MGGVDDGCQVSEVLRIDGWEKRGFDGVFKFERKTRIKRRITRMRTSLLVGGDGAILT